MKKKAIVLALCAGILTGTTAVAQKVEVIPESQNVIIYDNISPNTLGICFVVKRGESIDDNANVYAVKNAMSDANGKIEFSIVMPEEKNDQLSDGEYDIYIKEYDEPIQRNDEDMFTYASLDSRTGLLNSVKVLTAEQHEELKIILENSDNLIALKAIGCETEFYNEDVAEIMCTLIADFETVTEAELKDAYNAASAMGGFEDAGREEADELLRRVNPQFEGDRYEDIEDEDLTDWLSSYFAGKTYSNEKYEIANILYKFNTSVADKIDDLFEDYNDVLGITEDEVYEDYDNLKRKAKVNSDIAEALSDDPAKTVDELMDIVEEAIEENENSNGGGGGGDRDSSPSVISGIPTDTPVVVGQDPSFKDINDALWAKDAIIGLSKAGIVSGDENGNFRPNDYVSREEYVTMLVLAANKYSKDAVCDFDDVPKSAWYYSYVASANEYGVTHGISESVFGVGLSLTRQDMAVLSLRAKGDVAKVRDGVIFADNEDIADYAKEAVSELYMSGAVSGTGNGIFKPLGKATRAECAQIIFNLFLK